MSVAMFCGVGDTICPAAEQGGELCGEITIEFGLAHVACGP
jgi:hypothetical protein